MSEGRINFKDFDPQEMLKSYTEDEISDNGVVGILVTVLIELSQNREDSNTGLVKEMHEINCSEKCEPE